jgi:hypothetical protein
MKMRNPIPVPKDCIMVQNFSIEQNKALWAEIAESVKETRLLERYAVIGTAAYWSFLIKDGRVPLTVQNYLEWAVIPALFAVLGGARSLALLWRVMMIGAFLRGIETSADYPGWETFLHPLNGKHSKPFLTTALIIWICILLTALLVPLLFLYFGFQRFKF